LTTEPDWRAVDADPGYFVEYLDAAARASPGRFWQRCRAVGLGRGDVVLDLGSGLGADAHGMARLVGRRGRVIGVDFSEHLVREAVARAPRQPAAVFVIGDAHRLPFRANAFDACTTERVLQHLDEPATAVAEVARVLRGGGRVVMSEPDLGTITVDSEDIETTAAIDHHRAARRGIPYAGRGLARLAADNGLEELALETDVGIVRSFDTAARGLGLELSARSAAAAGVINDVSADRWIADLRQRDSDGRFLVAWMHFICVAQKPAIGRNAPRRAGRWRLLRLRFRRRLSRYRP
jgi:SAM-dependent methyltransferase